MSEIKYSIAILIASVRDGRKSNRVAHFLKNQLEQSFHCNVHSLDLAAYNFPIFTERLKMQSAPPPLAIEFAKIITQSDGVIIVTPEYNGGYPASLKNVIDLLVEEWRKKPVAITTVSDGSFGGSQVLTSLQFSLWKLRALTVTAQLPMPNVDQIIDENGNPLDDALLKRSSNFLRELMWFIQISKIK